MILTTTETWPCPRCGKHVPPRHRRVLEQPRWPLCDRCVPAAGLAGVDAVLAAASTVEAWLESDPAHAELLELIEPLCRAAWDLAEQHMPAQ